MNVGGLKEHNISNLTKEMVLNKAHGRTIHVVWRQKFGIVSVSYDAS